MRSAHKHIVIATLLAGFGFMATAQTPAPSATAGGPPPLTAEQKSYFEARMQERIAKRQAALKEKLKITPAQENAWNAWTAAMKPPAGLKRGDRAEFDTLTTPERIDRMRALRAERQAEMDKRGDATKAFYSALNAEQRKLFDEETLRHRGFGGRGFGGHHRGWHHG